MTGDHPKELFSWLPLAEFWYNTNFHLAIQTTQFQAAYRHAPPIHLPYLVGTSTVDSIDRSLAAREKLLHDLKNNLSKAQQGIKQLADSHRIERSSMLEIRCM